MRRSAVLTLAFVGLVGLAAACGDDGSSSAPGATVGGRQVQGFGESTVVIRRADGSVCHLCTYVARTVVEHDRGLMEVTDLAGHDGMIFEFDQAEPLAFWMKETVMPITAAWFGADGGFLAAYDMAPCPSATSTCPSYGPAGPAQHVLEVPLGALESLRIGEGSKLESVTDGPCPPA